MAPLGHGCKQCPFRLEQDLMWWLEVMGFQAVAGPFLERSRSVTMANG